MSTLGCQLHSVILIHAALFENTWGNPVGFFERLAEMARVNKAACLSNGANGLVGRLQETDSLVQAVTTKELPGGHTLTFMK